MPRPKLDPEEKKRRRRESVNKYAKKYYSEHREEMAERSRILMKKSYDEDPEKFIERSKARYRRVFQKYKQMVALEEMQRKALDMSNNDPENTPLIC